MLLTLKDARAVGRLGLVFGTSSAAAALVEAPGRDAPGSVRAGAGAIRECLTRSAGFALIHVPTAVTQDARALADSGHGAPDAATRHPERSEADITVKASWHGGVAAIAYVGRALGQRVAIRHCENINGAEMDALLLAMKDARTAGHAHLVFATDNAAAALVDLPKRSAPSSMRAAAAAIRHRLEQNPGWRLVHVPRRMTSDARELATHQPCDVDSPAAVPPELDVAVDASLGARTAAIAYAGRLLGERVAFCACNDINEAEIRAVLLAMESARAAGHRRVVLGTDNEVAALVHVPSRCAPAVLHTAAEDIRKHLHANPGWQLLHVPKSMTTEAHALATQGRRDAECTSAHR